MNTYRSALIGLSGIASAPVTPSLSGSWLIFPYAHASALAAIPNADCDLFPAVVERWGTRWPDLRTYTDASQTLDTEEIEILGICTPDDRHADLFIDAANRGIPAILREKPLATTLADADRITAAAESNRTIAAVEHTRRWDPYFRRAKERIHALAHGARVRSTLRQTRDTVAIVIGVLASHQQGNRLVELASLGAPVATAEAVS